LNLQSAASELIRLQRLKGQLATECYDLLDSHVRRLDVSLKKYEVKLRKGNFEVSATPIDRRRGTKRIFDQEAKEIYYLLLAELQNDIEKGATGGGGGHSGLGGAAASGAAYPGYSASSAGGLVGSNGQANGSSGDQSGEPVYCFCRKVSYGAMVACDNDDCEVEWFHFACVGLETKPRGKWFCPDCRRKKKKLKI